MFQLPKLLNESKCPICGVSCQEAFESSSPEPFTAMSPLEGLYMYGPYDCEKTVVCESNRWLHFIFVPTGEHRLVLLAPRSPAPRNLT